MTMVPRSLRKNPARNPTDMMHSTSLQVASDRICGSGVFLKERHAPEYGKNAHEIYGVVMTGTHDCVRVLVCFHKRERKTGYVLFTMRHMGRNFRYHSYDYPPMSMASTARLAKAFAKRVVQEIR